MKKLFLLCLLLLAALSAAALWFQHWMNAPFAIKQALEISVKNGSSARAAALQAQKNGLPLDERLFSWLARYQQSASKLKPGIYAVKPQDTPASLLDKMVRGDTILSSLTFVEGITFAQMRAQIAEEEALQPSSAKLDEAALLKKIGASETQAEGLFFPNTYRFARGSSDVDIFKQAYAEQKKRLNAAWEARAPDAPYNTPYELLIMASIIEKETGQASERPMVAAVFVNRLKIGMRLQTDPTVIYGMGENFDGNLRKRDLQTDTLYNTYTRAGLPPTPIALPGAASLAAAAQPAQSKALYFVARGDGTSQFSDNLEDHNRAVNKYQRGGS